MRKLILLTFTLLLLGVGSVAAQDTTVPQVPDAKQYQLLEITNGLQRPLLLTNANDGSNRMFIVEQGGQISTATVVDGTIQKKPFLDVSGLVGTSGNEQGLLGLAFHPQFKTNGQFFIDYTDVNGNTVVARYSVLASDPTVGDPNSASFVIQIKQPFPNHNGGNLAFGPDGYLYIGMGDGGSQGDPNGNGQNPKALLAKLLRLDIDSAQPYAVPKDNPFATNPGFCARSLGDGLTQSVALQL